MKVRWNGPAGTWGVLSVDGEWLFTSRFPNGVGTRQCRRWIHCARNGF